MVRIVVIASLTQARWPESTEHHRTVQQIVPVCHSHYKDMHQLSRLFLLHGGCHELHSNQVFH
jgi:hypothetical protein